MKEAVWFFRQLSKAIAVLDCESALRGLRDFSYQRQAGQPDQDEVGKLAEFVDRK